MVWNGHESVVVEQVPEPQAGQAHRRHRHPLRHLRERFGQGVPGRPVPWEVARLFERRLLVGTYDEHTLESYVAELDQVAEQGFAINDGRTSVEEVGVAAPVRDHRGVVVAAVLLSAPRFRVPPAMLDVLAAASRETADGGHGPARGRHATLAKHLRVVATQVLTHVRGSGRNSPSVTDSRFYSSADRGAVAQDRGPRGRPALRRARVCAPASPPGRRTVRSPEGGSPHCFERLRAFDQLLQCVHRRPGLARRRVLVGAANTLVDFFEHAGSAGGAAHRSG